MRISVCIIVLILYCVLIVHATPPPPEGRAYYLIPGPVGPYYNQSIDLGFSVSSPVLNEGKSSFFPKLSGYWLMKNFTHQKTGKIYPAEVWYFNDYAAFNSSREDLMHHLQIHGTVSPVTLDISEELALTDDPYISGLRVKNLPAMKYTGPETSGYFIFLSTDFFPGENYYIAYYGVDEQSDLEDETHQIKTLIMSCLPGFINRQNYSFDPAPPVLKSSLPGAIVISALVCFGVAMNARKKGEV
jgi:hypothetical protein